MAVSQADLVVCEHCDALHRWRPLGAREVAYCTRCHAVLGRGHRLDAQALLALTLAALCVLLIANLASIATIRLRGTEVHTTLPQAISVVWRQGEYVVALLATLTAVVAPALLILLRLYLLLPLARGATAAHFALSMRVLHEVSRWSMVEVMMVAAVVSIVRMAGLANADPGPGMFAFGALALLLAALESGGLRHLWMHAPADPGR